MRAASDAPDERTIFISRAGADAAVAAEVADIVEAAGYRAILQQRNFRHANFIKQMHDAIKSGARVVALLSPDYLLSKYCEAEWMNAIAEDPLNEQRRLIVLRIADCKPTGLLAGIDYVDAIEMLSDRPRFAKAVLDALRVGRSSQQAKSATVEFATIQPVPSFTGRERELDAIARGLHDARVVVIHGMGGTGKSALAKEYAWRNRRAYDVVWMVSAETEDGIIDALIRLGAELDPSAGATADRRADAQRVLAMLGGERSRPPLLIFDNVPDESVLHAWTPGEGMRILATSRSSAWAKSVAAIPLGVWPRADGIHYLQHESGRTDLSDLDADSIAARLGDLPLALVHAAAYLKRTKTVGAAAYLARLEHHLEQAPKGADYPRAVFATFREAIAEAEANAPGSTAIAALAAFFAPDAIPEELFRPNTAADAAALRPHSAGKQPAIDLASALGDESRVFEALGELDRLSLIVFRPESRTFAIHRLVQSASRSLVTDRTAWALRAVAAANAMAPLDAANFADWSVSERLLPHARAALEEVPVTTNDHDVWRLATQVARYLSARGAFQEAEPFFRRALNVVEALHEPPHLVLALMLNNLGDGLRDLKRFDEAEPLLDRALLMTEQLVPGTTTVAAILNNLGGVYEATGRLEDAERVLRRVITIDEQHYGPDHPEVATDLNNLGVTLSTADRHREAEDALRRALAIDRKCYETHHPTVARDLRNLAFAVYNLGRFDEATAILGEALEITERVFGRTHFNFGRGLAFLGQIYAESGRAEEAERYLRYAMPLYEAALDPDDPEVAILKENLAFVLETLNRNAEAAELRAQVVADQLPAGDSATRTGRPQPPGAT